MQKSRWAPKAEEAEEAQKPVTPVTSTKEPTAPPPPAADTTTQPVQQSVQYTAPVCILHMLSCDTSD